MVYEKKIGFIGLGNIGMPMATTLVKKGFQVVAFDVRPQAVEELVQLGAVSADCPRGIGEKCEIVILMVKNNSQIDMLLAGKDGLWNGLRK
ncbi:MAG: NAD(P)-binding domain-containing protein, partial [Dehalococcoidia bacterium]|nr:NAD(P)-binding domain-containing protein [Dehalococcoidia bacterium]